MRSRNRNELGENGKATIEKKTVVNMKKHFLSAWASYIGVQLGRTTDNSF